MLLAGRLRDVIAVIIGHILEYFDMMLYVHLMVVLTPLFFPSENAHTSGLLALGSFALTYLCRPFGALLFGYLGDHKGRIYSLNICLLLMALGTGGIGLLPTYAYAGIISPLLLLICRGLQGISSAGEPIGASVFLIESNILMQRKSLLSSIVNACAAFGGVLAAGTGAFFVAVYGEKTGWRYPFLLGSCIGFYGIYLRHHLREGNLFTKAKESAQNSTQSFSMLQVCRQHWRAILCVMGMSSLNPLGMYGVYVYGADILKTYTALSTASILIHNSIIMLVDASLSIVAGLLADRFGQKQVGLSLSALLTLFALPVFYLLLGGNPTYISITLWQLSLLMLCSAYETPLRPLIMELFPTVGRFSAYGIGWSMGRVLAYTTGTYFCILLKGALGPTGPGWLFTLLGGIGFLSLWQAKPLYETHGISS